MGPRTVRAMRKMPAAVCANVEVNMDAKIHKISLKIIAGSLFTIPLYIVQGKKQLSFILFLLKRFAKHN
jgi:hypothetical protein